MTATSMMKKRGREGQHCDNRHCISDNDAHMPDYDAGTQRTREQREWRKEQDN